MWPAGGRRLTLLAGGGEPVLGAGVCGLGRRRRRRYRIVGLFRMVFREDLCGGASQNVAEAHKGCANAIIGSDSVMSAPPARPGEARRGPSLCCGTGSQICRRLLPSSATVQRTHCCPMSCSEILSCTKAGSPPGWLPRAPAVGARIATREHGRGSGRPDRCGRPDRWPGASAPRACLGRHVAGARGCRHMRRRVMTYSKRSPGETIRAYSTGTPAVSLACR